MSEQQIFFLPPPDGKWVSISDGKTVQLQVSVLDPEFEMPGVMTIQVDTVRNMGGRVYFLNGGRTVEEVKDEIVEMVILGPD